MFNLDDGGDHHAQGASALTKLGAEVKKYVSVFSSWSPKVIYIIIILVFNLVTKIIIIFNFHPLIHGLMLLIT